MSEPDPHRGQPHSGPRGKGVTQEVLREYDIISVGDDDSQDSVVQFGGETTSTVGGKSDSSSRVAAPHGGSTKRSGKARAIVTEEEADSVVVVKENPSAPTIISTLDKDTDFMDVNVFRDTASGKVQEGPAPIICPNVNCPEKIIICLDADEEVNTTIFRSRSGDKYSGLELAKRALKMFVLHKNQMDPRHQFAFMIFQQDPTVLQTFTSNPQEIFRALDFTDEASQNLGPLNLANLFDAVQSSVRLPEPVGDPTVIPPPYIVRMLLVYGRSQEVPFGAGLKAQRELEASPHFFTDVLYIHEPPNETNKCEEIFQVLCDLDHNGLSYIFEQSKSTPILNSGAKLLAHPLQRPQQLEASYKIGTGPTVNQLLQEERVH